MSSTNTDSRAARPETRADVTDRIAREIITAEAAQRQQQTARLRAARLGKETVGHGAERAAPVGTQRKGVR